MPFTSGSQHSTNIPKTFLAAFRHLFSFLKAFWVREQSETKNVVLHAAYFPKLHRAHHFLEKEQLLDIPEMAWLCATFYELTESGFKKCLSTPEAWHLARQSFAVLRLCSVFPQACSALVWKQLESSAEVCRV